MRAGALFFLALACGWRLSAQADPNIGAYLSDARAAEQAGDFARAGEAYRNALKLQPNLAGVHQSLALTCHLRNQFAEAIPEFRRALELDPSLWGSFLFLGIDYYKTNQFEAAIASLKRSLELNAAQAEPEARFWLGASQAALGRYDEAVRDFQRAAVLRPTDVEVVYQLARTYDQKADALFQQIGRIDRRAPAAALLQAEYFLSENRQDLATVEYRRALALKPDYAGSIPELETPRKSASAARSADAEHAAAVHPLVQAREALAGNRLGQADTILADVLRKEPSNLDALLLLGNSCKQHAASLLAAMIAIDPDSYRVHQLAGEQYERRGDYNNAIQSYEKALKKNPDLAGVRYSLGSVYWKLGKHDAAERWLTDELSRNPNHGLAHYRLGSLYADAGKADEAISHLQEALKSHPELTAARFDLGRALVLKGRYPEAVTALQEVVAVEPANDRVHYLLANAYRRQGRTEQAASEMAKYQELTRKRLDDVQQEVRDVSRAVETTK